MPGHKLRSDEVENGVGDFLRTACAMEWSPPNEIRLPFRRISGHGNRSGRDRIHAHGGSKFLCQNSRHHDDSGFGEGVREKFFPTKQTTDIREIDDYAVAGLSQIRSGSLRTKKWRFEIGI